ncbi:DUF1559 family PulG-like putative transporter [Paludisphaera mucosa]|uniref:DUF1559 domain-containing protein n=1 Tax=Paludisphaera mucosa TaxID=3030827 RepID=A0ABT6FKC5_9BACT|nr:DUF1559 domain-containing protein [Paludisphaera mucosa]MDG3007840.1 DUF1559 domain-containing protein [Paludisphaera mucosa]
MTDPEVRGRSGMTLIELLVVIAIAGLLAALLIPAVQSSREAARATTCRNNLRQVMLGVLNHESAARALPDLYNGGFLPRPRSAIDEFHFHPWRTAILPGLERSDVLASLNLDLPATTHANQTGINAAIATFVCPSSSNPTPNLPDVHEWQASWTPGIAGPLIGAAARADYEVVGGVRTRPPGTAVNGGVVLTMILDGIEFGAWGEPTYQAPTVAPVGYRKARLADVRDGLSNTVFVGERAGRPDCYDQRSSVDPYPYPNHPNGCGDSHQAAWAISTHFPWLVFAAQQPVNQTNVTGFYAFHPAGAYAAMGDGSVRLLRATAAPAVTKALATRAGGEAGASDF